MPAQEHHLAVTRTARYHTLGDPASALREVWFVLHGHAQLSQYFIRHFAVLDDGTRLIVAPEGLNRFYIEPTMSRSSDKSRVGATWMTREDRLADIADYVAYLDALCQKAWTGGPGDGGPITVLGFSQGGATAIRWVAKGKVRADHLIVWAAALPADLDDAAKARLRGIKVTRVLGDRDDLADPDALSTEDARWRALGVESPVIRFDGGHELDAAVLRSLSA